MSGCGRLGPPPIPPAVRGPTPPRRTIAAPTPGHRRRPVVSPNERPLLPPERRESELKRTETATAWNLDHRPARPQRRDAGIGVVGAGFIVRDCHLVAYAEASYRVVGITSRSVATAREVAALRGVPKVYDSLEEMLDDPAIEVVDIAVPPTEQPGVIRRVLAHPRRVRGILRRSRWPCPTRKRRAWSTRASEPGWCSRSTRTCGMIRRCGRSRPCSTRAG